MKIRLSQILERFNKIDYLMVTASTVVCSLISFVYSVLTRKYVEPVDFGIYSTCTIIQAYMGYIQLGTFNSYNRDYPQLLGGKKVREASELKNTTITFMIILYGTVTVLAVIFLGVLYQAGIFGVKYFWGFLLSVFIVLLDTIANFSMYTVRVHDGYSYSAVVGIVKTFVSVGVGIVTIKQYGYYGLYAMPVVGALVSIAMYFQKGLSNINFRIDKTILKTSMVTGIPLMVNTFIWTVMSSVDKFVILAFMTTEDLGVYSIALMSFSTMVLIPQSISQVFYNKVSIIYGKTKDLRTLLMHCNKYTMLNSLCTSAVAVCAFFILPIFVSYFMPSYSEGVDAAQILLVGVAIYGTTLLYGNIFSILKWNKDLIINSILLCVFNVIFSSGLVVIAGRDIKNVAIGTALSYVAYSFVLLWKISHKMNFPISKLIMVSWGFVLVSVVPAIIIYFCIDSVVAAFGISILILSFLFVAYLCFLKKK